MGVEREGAISLAMTLLGRYLDARARAYICI
jgi:hypothetical protein